MNDYEWIGQGCQTYGEPPLLTRRTHLIASGCLRLIEGAIGSFDQGLDWSPEGVMAAMPMLSVTEAACCPKLRRYSF